MSYIMFSIVLLMVGKDTFQLGDPYVMRGGAQILALLVAIGALLYRPPRQIFSRYWPLVGYVGSMLLTSVQSSMPTFVILQIGSLVAILLFSIAYFDVGTARKEREAALVRGVIGVYLCAALASLVIAKFAPGIAYETLYAGDAYGNESRFRGLFSKSAMMGAAGGLLVGAAWYGVKSHSLRILIAAPGAICMALTVSRTFWLATVVSGIITAWYYHPSRMKLILQGLVVTLLLGAIGLAANMTLNHKTIENTFRLHTITTLTGRVDLWERGLRALEYRPWLGYGFTFGSEGLQQKKAGIGSSSQQDARKIAKVSLHNGYMQSFLDSGIVGTFFYASTIVLAIFRFIRHDFHREYPVSFYCILFLALANCGESIIYSASVFHSVLFWMLAAFALGLKERRIHRLPKKRPMLLNEGRAQETTVT